VTRGSAAWLGVAALCAAAAGLAWNAPREVLDWQPARAWTEPWRLWSAALVHWSPEHLLANEVGCVVVAAFGVAARLPDRCAIAWLAAWPLGHAALIFQPSLAIYGGLSGVLHAGVAIAAWHVASHERGHRRLVGIAVGVGLIIKIALERPWLMPTQITPEWNFPVAPLAHATGAAAGLASAVIGDVITARWRGNR
jgi:rhomboid family GlyGly-CTERM serine protease